MAQAIPRIVIAATQSGAGKTTIVTGLLTALRQRGIVVQSFKVGPDYIDPGYHTLASGRAGHNLDTWLVPKEKVEELFAYDAGDADIAIIEGVMGLFDGGKGGVSSTAEIAKLLRAPVVLVLDVKSMGESAAAIAQGFRDYDPEVNLAGVIVNRLGSETHEKMIRGAMKKVGIPVLGAMRRNDSLHMPERHLGLVPAAENAKSDALELMGAEVARQLDLESILRLACMADDLETEKEPVKSSSEMTCRIAVAHDEAFSFYYSASLRELQRRGAELVPFRPLHDAHLPKADGLILGGGFPEMFAEKLATNYTMRASIREAATSGMPIYAECGGYMYLKEELIDFSGTCHAMAGVLPGTARMTENLQMVGYVEAELLTETVLGEKGLKLHGHEFHFSEETGEEKDRPLRFTKLRNGQSYAAGSRAGNVLGSYLHLHFAGCPEAADHFVEACRKWAH
ncbi:MAG: cobyrinate a,c-diamide synthase [Mitsuokella sp.]